MNSRKKRKVGSTGTTVGRPTADRTFSQILSSRIYDSFQLPRTKYYVHIVSSRVKNG